jgi:hypothetical protein
MAPSHLNTGAGQTHFKELNRSRTPQHFMELCVGLTTLPPSVSWLSRQCAILNISQPYGHPRPVTGITFLLYYSAYFQTLKIGAVCSCETSANYYHTTRRSIQENSSTTTLHSHRRESQDFVPCRLSFCVWSLAPQPKLQAGGLPLVGCSRLVIQYIRSYPQFPPSATRWHCATDCAIVNKPADLDSPVLQRLQHWDLTHIFCCSERVTISDKK